MPVKLNSSGGGSVTLTTPSTASDYTVTVPAITGTMSVQASTGYTTGSVLFINSSGQVAQNNSQLFWDNTNNRLGIGTATPAYSLDVLGPLAVRRSTVSARVSTLSNENGNFEITADSNYNMVFIAGGSERARIDTSGNVLVTGGGGLGYGTGSGGTVTQATSKTTGVTINKTVGQITTAADALGAGATAAFTVTNSTFAAVDCVVLNSQNINYSVRISDNAAGSFKITIKNESAGSLSQAVVINFAVIKGATS